MRRSGTIIQWNDEKGYGFIAPDDHSDDVFLHHRALVDRERRPQSGDRVSYEIGPSGEKGPRAERVTLRPGSAPVAPPVTRSPRRNASGAARRPAAPGAGRALSLILTLLLPTNVLGSLWLAATRGFIPPWVSLLYVVMSLLAFSAYALDKLRAQRGKWRISESTLHLFEMAGGWPGAFAAQRLLRHKSRKLSFQVTYWLIVLAHLAFWAWYSKRQLEGWS